MRIKIRNELLLLGLLVGVLVAVIYLFPSNILRIIMGLPFVLFFPGYALIAALFPRREGISDIVRVGLSFGLSLAVVPLIGLLLNFTPWGIRLESILWSIASFIFITSAIAWLRRKRLLEEERFGIEFRLAVVSWAMVMQNKVLSIILVLAVLGAFGMASYAIVTPKIGQKFTEFYILDLEGQATDYPKKLKVGEEGKVVTVIANHEYHTVSYLVEVRIDGMINNEIGSILLEHEQKHEVEVSFTPEVAGEKQKVEFLLYKDGEVEPYLDPLRLWVDVME